MRLTFYSFGLGKGLNQVNMTLYCTGIRSQDLLHTDIIQKIFFLEILTYELFKKGRSFWTYPHTN
jgi:hypothetical protein